MSIQNLRQARELLAEDRAIHHTSNVGQNGLIADSVERERLRRYDCALAALDAALAAPAREPVARVLSHGATVRLEWASVHAAHNAKPGPLYADWGHSINLETGTLAAPAIPLHMNGPA